MKLVVRRILAWGVFDKDDNDAQVSGDCAYRQEAINEMRRIREEHKKKILTGKEG